MTTTSASSQRRLGLLCLSGAALTVAGCLVIAIAQATGNVSSNLFRAPLSRGAFLAFTPYAALTHALILTGVIALARSGAVGEERPARIAIACALAGTALLFVCEWASIPFVGAHTSDTGATIVDAAFGLASVLATLGMIGAGASVARRARWTTWRRYAPLACGMLSLVVIPLQFGSAIWVGVAIYGVGYGLLGSAVIAESVAAPSPVLTTA
jgi:hypothetical protein